MEKIFRGVKTLSITISIFEVLGPAPAGSPASGGWRRSKRDTRVLGSAAVGLEDPEVPQAYST